MAFYTDGVVPWNSLDDNTRAPLASELESGYPCGEADQQLFNWTAGWPIGNIWNMILQSGITPDPDKLLDLARAVQAGKVTYGAAAGTANALTLALSPTPASLTVGMVVGVLIATENTGAATLNVNGAGALPIRTMGGNAIQRGDLLAGAIVHLVYTGTAWLLGGIAKSEVPQIPTADIVLYVRTDGNDNNDGGANTAARAFLTIQKAIDTVTARYATSASFSVRIVLGIAGTYAAAKNDRYPGSITIEGGGGGSYFITGGDVSIGAPCSFASRTGRVTLKGVNLINTAASGFAVSAASLGGYLFLDAVSITSSLNNASYVPIYIAERGVLSLSTSFVLNGGDGTTRTMRTFIQVGTGGVFNGAPAAMTAFIATTNFIAGFVEAQMSGVAIFAGISLSPAGSFPGPRYSVYANGVINTYGGGANFFPGSSAGSAATGGQYL